MTPTDCRYYLSCSAPLCPLTQVGGQTLWFLDDEVCRRNDAPSWVKRQRKIVNRFSKDLSRDAFTVTMLEHLAVIGKRFSGLDLDRIDATPENVQKWVENHPARQPLSDDKKAFLRKLRTSRIKAGFNLENPKRLVASCESSTVQYLDTFDVVGGTK